MARVRAAGPGDVEALIEMGRAMHAESPRYRGMRFDPQKLRALGERLPAAGGVMLIAEEGGQPVGLFVGFLNDRWFGPDTYVTDLAVYVKPEHRGGSAFVRLVQAAETWAAAAGAGQIDLGITTDVHTERTVHAYERLGYTLVPTRVVSKKLDHVHRS